MSKQVKYVDSEKQLHKKKLTYAFFSVCCQASHLWLSSSLSSVWPQWWNVPPPTHTHGFFILFSFLFFLFKKDTKKNSSLYSWLCLGCWASCECQLSLKFVFVSLLDDTLWFIYTLSLSTDKHCTILPFFKLCLPFSLLDSLTIASSLSSSPPLWLFIVILSLLSPYIIASSLYSSPSIFLCFLLSIHPLITFFLLFNHPSFLPIFIFFKVSPP